jgi:hypothetical protein
VVYILVLLWSGRGKQTSCTFLQNCLGLLISRRKNVYIEVCWGKSFFFTTKNLNIFLKHLLLGKGINEQLYTAKYLISQFKRVTVPTYFFPLAINRNLSILEGVWFAYYRFESIKISKANDAAEITDVSLGDKNQWCRTELIATIFWK